MFFEKYKNHIIAGAVVFILLINFVFVPYLYRRQATQLVYSFLKGWRSGDASAGMYFWKDKKEFPPIYDLDNYKITRRVFDKKDRMRRAVFDIRMDFEPGNILPDKKIWRCEMLYTKKGWRVVDFSIQE